MRRVLIIALATASILSPVQAQQGPDFPSSSSEQGPNFPAPGSDRGPDFPKSVSPTETNPTNWVASQPQYTDPAGPNARWNGWYARRGWRGGWR
jgi:hypothetical protein